MTAGATNASTSLLPGAVFHRCALQVNPHRYAEKFRGQALSEDETTHAREIVDMAVSLGISVLAITDHNDVAGVPRPRLAHSAQSEAGKAGSRGTRRTRFDCLAGRFPRRSERSAQLQPQRPTHAPLIVKQPEDDVDNRCIMKGVVPQMREEKQRRQFVFSTRAATLPVFGDAEMIVGLSDSGEADGELSRIRPEQVGSIDARLVRLLVEEILEGGREAFERRSRKYGS